MQPDSVSELITLLRIDIAVLTEKVDAFNRVESRVDHLTLNIGSLAQDLKGESVKLEKFMKDQAKLNADVKTGQRWAVGTAISGLGLMATFISVAWSLFK